MRNSPADIRVSEEGEGRGASGTRAGIPMQHLERDPAKQDQHSTAQGKGQSGTDIHTQPVEEPHARAGGYPLRNAAHREPMLEQVYPERL